MLRLSRQFCAMLSVLRSCALVKSPRCHLVHLRVLWEPYMVGCLPMFALQFIAWLHIIAKMSYAWRASQRDLRDPGKGGSWLSALLAGLFCWTPLQDLAPWSCFVVCFCARSQFISTVAARLLQRYFQVSPKLLGFGEACPCVLKVSCCRVASWA